MSTIAIVCMLTTQGLVIFATVYFLYKVLADPGNKKIKDSGES